LHVPWHALAASHQAMTVEEEEEHSPKSEASREADEADRLPVEKGQIRLHGHFCGVATTASHRLELAIPVREQVDINLLYPLLAGLEASFHKRAEKTAETDASPTSPDSPDSPKVELWTRLKDLLELDRISPEEESPELVEEVLQSLGPAWQETFERCNSRRSSNAESFLSGEDELKAALREEERELRARKAQERAMEIDIEAKEALVGRLMEQREELKMKTQELTKQLEQGVAERWFCGCLQGVSSLFSRKTEEAGDVLETIVETLEGTGEDEGADKKWVELKDDQILLDGHFAGRMVTRMHCLEIAMPVGATLPSTPLLEVLRAVKDANRAVEAESFQQRAKVVESLLAVVEADVDPALRATEVDEERSDPTITPAEPAGEAVPKYEDMSKELEILRSQSSRMQQETEQLRIKNAALVNFLSSAERSAAKLRAALTDAGITPVLSPDTSPKTTRAGQPPPPDLQADIQELESWAMRLRGLR